MAFNGDGAVRAWGTSDTSANNTKSYGISSLADSGTGRLGVTMSVASSDHHYCVITNYYDKSHCDKLIQSINFLRLLN